MTKQEQIIYKVASAIQMNANDDYIKGLIEMASIALEVSDRTVAELAAELLGDNAAE